MRAAHAMQACQTPLHLHSEPYTAFMQGAQHPWTHTHTTSTAAHTNANTGCDLLPTSHPSHQNPLTLPPSYNTGLSPGALPETAHTLALYMLGYQGPPKTCKPAGSAHRRMSGAHSVPKGHSTPTAASRWRHSMQQQICLSRQNAGTVDTTGLQKSTMRVPRAVAMQLLAAAGTPVVLILHVHAVQ